MTNTLIVTYENEQSSIFKIEYDLTKVEQWYVKWDKLYITLTDEDEEDLIILPTFAAQFDEDDCQSMKHPDTAMFNNEEIEL